MGCLEGGQGGLLGAREMFLDLDIFRQENSLGPPLVMCALFFHIGISHISKNRKKSLARAGVAQWIECQPENQRAAGLIPSQGTCLGCGPGPQLGA